MQEIYFHEPRFYLTTAGEFVVRFATKSFYIIFSALTLLLLFSDLSSLRWAGVLFALFLGDRLLHLGHGEENLSELKGPKINIASALTPSAYNVLRESVHKSFVTGQNFYLLLLKALTEKGDIKEALRRLDIPLKDFLEKLDAYLEESEGEEAKKNRDEIMESLSDLGKIAYVNALKTYEKFVEPRNFFVALASINYPPLVKLFDLFQVKSIDLQEAVIFGRYRKAVAGLRRLPSVLGGFVHRPGFLRHRIMNRAWTARPTPTLDRFGTDLTDLARREQVGFLIGHEKEFDELLGVISRPQKPNALLVGEPGTGKSTLIAHLAFRMVKDRIPPALFDKRLVSLEVNELVSNAAPEVLAGRLQKIAEEIILAGNIVLFIPNIHNLFRTSGDAKAMNAIDLLLPVIESEAIPIVGETYPREFKQYIEPRTDFLEQFEVIKVDEISEEEALRFLIYYGLILEKEYKIFTTFRAIQKCVELAHRYFRERPLPGSAVWLLKQALGKAHNERLKTLNEEVVIAVAEQQSRIPIQKASGAEVEKLLNLENIIHQKLINQDAAVRAVARALREYRSGLKRKGGPIAAFLFVGPTGVGKTELAKILAESQFGSEESMHRFDMSEYQEKSSIQRFIGAGDGGLGGSMANAVMENPYSLILLDEFEKAHPDILNLFLQVFDDGRLTDSLGRTVSFDNTIIIATSNAHSDFIKKEIERGESIEKIGESLKKKLTDYFRPELINRFSDVIVFRDLKPAEIYAIAGLLLGEIVSTLRKTHGIGLEIDEGAVKKIAELGFSPVFGARPLRQVISEKVRSVLAEKILRKEIARGNSLKLVFENDGFQFKITE